MFAKSTFRAPRPGIALSLLLALAAAGCGNGKAEVESSDHEKQLAMMLIAYHDKNGSWPDSLDQAKSLVGQNGPLGPIGGGKDYATLLSNPLTGDNPGYEYVKPAAAANAPILYQLKGGKRDASLAVAYPDGSVRKMDGAP